MSYEETIEMNDHSAHRRALLAGLGGLAAGALVAGKAKAGPLDPPPGPILPTMKPLDQIEPRTAINATNTPGSATAVFRITQPGSYYLTGNLAGVSGKHGIEIASNNVSLDLMGFEIAGVPGSLDGVTSNGNLVRTVTVANGGIRDWGQHGVSLAGFFHRASGLLVSGCAQSGISLAFNATFEGCRASGCGAQGFKATDNAVFRSCTAHTNAQAGIEAGEGAVVESCLSQGNTKEGFRLGDGCAVHSCVGKDNTDFNFRVTPATGAAVAQFSNCTAFGSVTKGGFYAEFASFADCVANANFLDGIRVDFGSVVSGCTASSNNSVGILALRESIVMDCTTKSNGIAGIWSEYSCLIARNQCSNNGFDTLSSIRAGIYAGSNRTRIQDNNCTDNHNGIKAVSGCFIARNTCKSSTLRNWDIAAGSICLVVNATPAGAILGNSGGVSPGSTDPNANFTF